MYNKYKIFFGDNYYLKIFYKFFNFRTLVEVNGTSRNYGKVIIYIYIHIHQTESYGSFYRTNKITVINLM